MLSIASVKELETLIKMLRRQGVERFELNGMKFELGPVNAKKSGPDVPETQPELSEEELLMWSAEQ